MLLLEAEQTVLAPNYLLRANAFGGNTCLVWLILEEKINNEIKLIVFLESHHILHNFILDIMILNIFFIS